MSNKKIKFVLVTTDQDSRDVDVRNVSPNPIAHSIPCLCSLMICRFENR